MGFNLGFRCESEVRGGGWGWEFGAKVLRRQRGWVRKRRVEEEVARMMLEGVACLINKFHQGLEPGRCS